MTSRPGAGRVGLATAPRSKRAEVEACGLPQGSLGGIPPLAETARGRPGRPFSRAFLSFAVTSRIHLKVQLPSADSGILLKGPVCPRVRTRVDTGRRVETQVPVSSWMGLGIIP